jgi:hypothetical protein
MFEKSQCRDSSVSLSDSLSADRSRDRLAHGQFPPVSHHQCHTTAMLTHSATATVSPLPLLLGLSLRAVRIFCYPLLTTPLTRRLVARWDVFVPPLPSCVVSSNFKLFSSSLILFRTTPFTSNLGAPPGCLGGGARFFPSRLVALMIRLTCVVDHRWSTSLHFRCQCTVYLSE